MNLLPGSAKMIVVSQLPNVQILTTFLLTNLGTLFHDSPTALWHTANWLS